MNSWSRCSAMPVAALLLALQGCASTPAGGNAQANDPIESWNRTMFGFNESLDENVLKPVATGYTKVVPSVARTGVTNFYNNFQDAWSAVNSFLQGKFENGGINTMRVITNTTLGVGGLFDWATEMRMERHTEDFGQTLGAWGFDAGPYVVWPLLGPSTLRDSFGLPLDIAASPSTFIDSTPWAIGVGVLQVIDTRAGLLGTTNLLDDIVIDKYVFVRDGHLQRRRSLVYDGNPPESQAK